jgi:putative N-acetylmannosamine-6-phosphate epimerase
MADLLERLRGGLIVSCQPVPGGPLDRPEITAAFALAALDGGARGLRIEGVANLRAVRSVTDAPIIGLIKVDLPDSPVRITPTREDVAALIAAGADIVAFDATDRPRPEPLAGIVAAIRGAGRLAMADCAVAEDGRRARSLGVEVLGSTMSGYLGDVVAEGRYHVPALAAAAMQAGADAVVAGSAITRPEHVTRWFVDAIEGVALRRVGC